MAQHELQFEEKEADLKCNLQSNMHLILHKKKKKIKHFAIGKRTTTTLYISSQLQL